MPKAGVQNSVVRGRPVEAACATGRFLLRTEPHPGIRRRHLRRLAAGTIRALHHVDSRCRRSVCRHATTPDRTPPHGRSSVARRHRLVSGRCCRYRYPRPVSPRNRDARLIRAERLIQRPGFPTYGRTFSRPIVPRQLPRGTQPGPRQVRLRGQHADQGHYRRLRSPCRQRFLRAHDGIERRHLGTRRSTKSFSHWALPRLRPTNTAFDDPPTSIALGMTKQEQPQAVALTPIRQRSRAARRNGRNTLRGRRLPNKPRHLTPAVPHIVPS